MATVTSIPAPLADVISNYLVAVALSRATRQPIPTSASSTLRDALSMQIAMRTRRPEYEAWPAVDEYLEHIYETDDHVSVSDVVAWCDQVVEGTRTARTRRKAA